MTGVVTNATVENIISYQHLKIVIHNNVEHPPHYCTHNSGVECIHVSSQLNFALGNAFKYLFRCSSKGKTLEDMRKAEWYLRFELSARGKLPWHSRLWNYFISDDIHAGELGPEISQILEYETRYSGHMAAALDAICVAGLWHGGPDVVKRAIRSVEKMIKIEEGKLP